MSIPDSYTIMPPMSVGMCHVCKRISAEGGTYHVCKCGMLTCDRCTIMSSSDYSAMCVRCVTENYCDSNGAKVMWCIYEEMDNHKIPKACNLKPDQARKIVETLKKKGFVNEKKLGDKWKLTLTNDGIGAMFTAVQAFAKTADFADLLKRLEK